MDEQSGESEKEDLIGEGVGVGKYHLCA